MTRRRLLCAAVGTGLLLAAVPALAEVDRGVGASAGSETQARALLERAVQAGRRLSWTGTQYVASWRKDAADTALVELQHDPQHGAVVAGAAEGDAAAVGVTAAVDPRMIARLAETFSLTVAGSGQCTGRSAAIVEAHRPGGQIAGRFWIDDATGLLLRREVFDGEGRRARSSAFVDLTVTGTAAGTGAGTGASLMTTTAYSGGERPAPAGVDRLRRDGWHVPDVLPGGFRLLETRRSDDVLHLAYTDGLSTLSLFAQPGELGDGPLPGFTAEQVDGAPVWVQRAAPERVVWSGGARVWTLVSDAPDDAVRAVVAALPRDPARDDGIRARFGRGLARLVGMLNPFD